MIPENNEIRFEPTTRCNYACAFCRAAQLGRPSDVLKPPFFREILDKILGETQQYDTVTFTGMGEPLLNPHLEEMTQYARKAGMRVLVVTNGSALTLKRFEALQAAGVFSIRVSFHGATPEGYARLTGRDLFDEVKANIFAASAARTTCQLILTWAQLKGVNDDDPQKWLDMFAGKADLYEIWTAHNWASTFGFRGEQSERLRTCGRIDRGPLQVQVDGTLIACCFDYDGVHQFGDLKKQTLAEAFEQPLFRKINECHATGCYATSGLICEHCDQRNADKASVLIYTSADVTKEQRILQANTTYKEFTWRDVGRE